jgi:hypothetical protein
LEVYLPNLLPSPKPPKPRYPGKSTFQGPANLRFGGSGRAAKPPNPASLGIAVWGPPRAVYPSWEAYLGGLGIAVSRGYTPPWRVPWGGLPRALGRPREALETGQNALKPSLAFWPKPSNKEKAAGFPYQPCGSFLEVRMELGKTLFFGQSRFLTVWGPPSRFGRLGWGGRFGPSRPLFQGVPPTPGIAVWRAVWTLPNQPWKPRQTPYSPPSRIAVWVRFQSASLGVLAGTLKTVKLAQTGKP